MGKRYNSIYNQELKKEFHVFNSSANKVTKQISRYNKNDTKLVYLEVSPVVVVNSGKHDAHKDV